MNYKTPLLSACLLAGLWLLSGCHENPMHNHRREANVTLLRDAAFAASKALNMPPLDCGRAYTHCMDGDKTTTLCKKLFALMLNYGKKRPGYAGLSYGDLTDEKTYIGLAEDFESMLFNTLDY